MNQWHITYQNVFAEGIEGKNLTAIQLFGTIHPNLPRIS